MQLLDSAHSAFDRKHWSDAEALYEEAVGSGEFLDETARSQIKAMVHLGRCMIYQEKTLAAVEVLRRAFVLDPRQSDSPYYLARSLHLAKDHVGSLPYYALHFENSKKPRPAAAGEYAEALHCVSLAGSNGELRLTEEEIAAYGAQADAVSERALAEHPGDVRVHRLLARMALDRADVPRIVEVLRGLSKSSLNSNQAARVLRQILYGALQAGLHEVIVRYPKLFAPISDDYSKAVRRVVAPGLPSSNTQKLADASLLFAAKKTTPRLLVSPRFIYADFVFISDTPLSPTERSLIARELVSLPSQSAGLKLVAGDEDAVVGLCIKSESLCSYLADVANEPSLTLFDLCLELTSQYRLDTRAGFVRTGAILKEKPRDGAVLLLTRSGSQIRGGGERFVRGCAEYYASLGMRVIVAGIGNIDAPLVLEGTGLPYETYQLPEIPTLVTHFLQRHEVRVIHTMSGLGQYASIARGSLNIRLIYGVHHFREFLTGVGLLGFSLKSGQLKADPTFEEVVRSSDLIYANSAFTQEMLQFGAGLSCPIVPSCSSERPEPLADGVRQGPILIVNVRPDKGWDLILEIAKLLPHRSFVAYANQGSSLSATRLVFQRGINNVTVVPHTDNLDELYQGKSLALVASFNFVETFGRVPVEAGTYGVPAIMARSGHLSNFGTVGDDVLEYDPQLWSRKIEEILATDSSYARYVSRAIDRAGRWSNKNFQSALGELIATLDRPKILVVVGAGLGNILHVTPMIAKLSESRGCRVDVLMIADHEGMLGMLQNPKYVRYVYTNDSRVAAWNYDEVFVTYSVTPPINYYSARRVYSARSYVAFDPSSDVHESTMNLEFLRLAAGIDYHPDDARQYFAGNHQWNPLETGNVVLHAGSKGGVWASKRWPHFEELAVRLKESGMRVISVGVKPEYVEGTEDYTDLTFDAMADIVAGAHLVVSNDSGVMNLANAIGVPVLALFGPTNPITRGPLKSPTTAMLTPTTCAPCERSENDRLASGECKCIRLLSVARVIEEANRMLQENSLPTARTPAVVSETVPKSQPLPSSSVTLTIAGRKAVMDPRAS